MSDCNGHCFCSSGKSTTPDTATPALTGASLLSHYRIRQMDCPAEERLVRMALEPLGTVAHMQFDLTAREVQLWHRADPRISAALLGLGLGAEPLSIDQPLDAATALPVVDTTQAAGERRVLQILLALNALMFVIELLAGWWAQSSGVLADGLDMLADAMVYGVALWAVGRASLQQRRAAHLAGWLQGSLALLILADALRRFIYGSEPLSAVMIGVGLLALAVNVSCLWLLLRQRGSGAHLKASLIFSANDVLANLGLLGAAALVAVTASRWPDLLIGVAIALLELYGAWRILRLR